jgi:hypothetical protein
MKHLKHLLEVEINYHHHHHHLILTQGSGFEPDKQREEKGGEEVWIQALVG